MSSFVALFLIIKLLANANAQIALIDSLPDTAFTASSSWDDSYLPQLCKSSSTTAWGPKTDKNEWLQIDLGLDYVITSISTWGSVPANEYVKTYTLNYATNINSFSIYPTTINANTNKDSEVNNILIPPFIARYLKFYPKTHKGWPSMRVEVFGYIGTLPPSKSPTQSPTANPTQPTRNPTPSPTNNPTPAPTKNPTVMPTNNPTNTPTQPTSIPTENPTTSVPTTSIPTTATPTTSDPTMFPTTTFPTTNYPTTSLPTTSIPTTNYPTTSIPTNNPITNIPTTTVPTRSPITGGEGELTNTVSTYFGQTDNKLNIENNNGKDLDEIIITMIYAVTGLIAFIILIIGLVCCYRIRMQKQIHGKNNNTKTNGNKEIVDMTVVTDTPTTLAGDTPTILGGVGSTTMGVIRLSSQSHISRENVSGTNNNYNGETNDGSDNDSLYEGDNNNNVGMNGSTPGGDIHVMTPKGPQNEYDEMYKKGTETKQ